MKSILTNKHISIQINRRKLECYIEPILMRCTDARPVQFFKTVTKETGGSRNVVLKENAKNLMDCKEIKQL